MSKFQSRSQRKASARVHAEKEWYSSLQGTKPYDAPVAPFMEIQVGTVYVCMFFRGPSEGFFYASGGKQMSKQFPSVLKASEAFSHFAGSGELPTT